MKKIIILILPILFLISCRDSHQQNYDQLIADLSSAMDNQETFPEKYLLTQDDVETLNKQVNRQQSDESLEAKTKAKHSQQKDQFKHAQRKLINDKNNPKYEFVKADSIGGFIDGIHFFDFALIYKKKASPDQPLKEKVCIFKMAVIDGEYKMIDDIYTGTKKRWKKNVERMKKQLKGR